jgi:hypothetical protein
MTSIKSETMDWTLWFYWIMATTAGWIIGQLFFSGIPIVISGAAISALQSAVLYKRIHKVWRWGVLSIIGWTAGYVLCVVLFSANADLMVGPFVGAAVGIAQWFLLKNEFDWAGWWIMISLLAWTSGLVIMPGLFTSGALPGALTGLTLVILFRFSSKHN